MSKFIKSYSHSSAVHNGKVIHDISEEFTIKDNRGNYKKKDRGKLIENRELEKNEIDEYISKTKPGYFISDNVFNIAKNLLFSDELPTYSKIFKGIEDKSSNHFTKNKIDNKPKHQTKKNQCRNIEKKYKLRGPDKKRSMKKQYRKRALKTHPDKCKRDECEAEFHELNNDYTFYMDEQNC